ncbi:MAG: DEAD/DEAH box helicase [Phycisphaerae bacterium]
MDSSIQNDAPVKSFADFPLLESIQQSIRAAGFERPTPIQTACIPPALEGKDVIGLAQTGTGKTAAFAIPIIQRLTNRPELGALVLAPTRELAAQITVMLNELGTSSGIRVATIVGGVPMDKDEAALRSWPNVLVATPGRLIDHLESGRISLREIEVLVVDEADRMHDMGFIPQIRRIIAALPAQRQTMMFTATMPADVERIARRGMRDPVRIQIGTTAPAHRARQELYELSEDAKTPLLLEILAASQGRVLIFLRTKRGVDKLASRISGRGFGVGRIHGDREQAFRDKALADFRSGHVRVLVATDIAARGLDISDIEHVINYDFPHHAEDYVHRIGRTARVEASGVATSFITRADRRFVNDVRRLIGDKLPQPTRLASYEEKAHRHGQHAAVPHGAVAHNAAGHGGHHAAQHGSHQASAHGQSSGHGHGGSRRRRRGRR